ncbi:probable cytochrome P450 304a1 [Zophobas morio]|uniref:probable cytochrome P450 304a1 n=1 Tax=Zophobas morio TaxID=2755281 RepID=UPI003083EC30
MLGFTTLLLILLILFAIYLHKSAKKRPKNFPPGPSKLPIWGSYWFLLKENYNMLHLSMESLAKQYKTDILGLFLGDFPTVVTLSHELTKEMLSRDEFVGRVDTVIVRVRSRGEPKGIFFSDGSFWKTHRKFSLRHLRDYGFGRRSDVMENYVADEVNYLLNFLTSEPTKDDMEVCKSKGQILVPDFLYGSLINIIMSMISSTQFDHHKVRKYAIAALNFMKSGDATGGAITITPWLKYFAPDYFGYTSADKDNAFLVGFMKEIVDEHLRTFSDDHHRDFIDDYISENLKQGTELDYNQLALVALDYMFPSPVGVGQTLSFFFGLLINHPDVQIKVQEELDRVVGRSRLPTLDDRKDLPYFEATLREVLRLIPVTPLGLPRRCVEDTTLGGYFIPKDTIMLPNLWTAHRDERVYENPDKFQPERFLDDHGNLIRKDTTVAFGAGKRLCAGETYARQTMFLLMTGIFQNFTIKSSTGKPVNFNKMLPGITLSFKEKTWVTAIPR